MYRTPPWPVSRWRSHPTQGPLRDSGRRRAFAPARAPPTARRTAPISLAHHRRLPQCFGGAGPDRAGQPRTSSRRSLPPLDAWRRRRAGWSWRPSARRAVRELPAGRAPAADKSAAEEGQSRRLPLQPVHRTPRSLQWKSGGMKPGSGIPGAGTPCGRAVAMAASASGVPIDPAGAATRNSVGAASILKSETAVYCFQTAHTPPTAAPAWPPPPRPGLPSNCRKPPGTVLARRPGSARSLEVPYA